MNHKSSEYNMSPKFIDKFKRPPRSPDMNAYNFFLWGYQEGRVYDQLPKYLENLKINIVTAIKNIKRLMLE